ncbi:MAG: NAD(P)H-dependent flavin oxidoreductase [Pseudobdellovibrionaceae bacterium]
MDFNTRLTHALQLNVPLIVAPMAGGPSSVDLVVAASESGALGSIGAAYLSPDKIKEMTNQVRVRTKKPILINLFIPSRIPEVSEDLLQEAIQQTKNFRSELGLPVPKVSPPYEEDFNKQFEAVLSLRPNAFSFVFGTLQNDYLKEAHKQGLFTIGTATTPEEALALEDSGVDAVVLQGVEAGGHRGIFDPLASDPNITMLDLLREVKGKIKVPLIAAGGIMTKDHVTMALRAGADVVQMGTAFLAVQEAGTSEPYRFKLLESKERKTRLTRIFSGRLARGLVNRFMEEMDLKPNAILPFPAQNNFTRDIRNASTAKGSADFLSLWCGTGTGDLWTGSTAKLIEQLFLE